MTDVALFREAVELGVPEELIKKAAAEVGISMASIFPERDFEEEERSSNFALLAEAAELGVPEDLIRAAAEEMGLGEDYRAGLESDAEAANAAKADADRRLEGAGDSIGENLLEGAAEIAESANAGAIFMGDVLTSPIRAAGKAIGLIPEDVNSISDLFPEGYQPGRGEYMEEREVAPYVGLAGDALLMGGAMAPVARAQGAGSAFAEAMGLGMTDDVLGAGSRAAQINVQNADEIARLNTMNPEEYLADLERSGSIDLSNKEQVQYVANKLNDEAAFEENAGVLDDLIEQEQYADDYSVVFRELDAESKALEDALPKLSGREKAAAERRLALNEERRLELDAVGQTKVAVDKVEEQITKQRAILASEKSTLEQVEEANKRISELTKEQRKIKKAAPKKVRYNDPKGKTQVFKPKYNPTVEAASDLSRSLKTINRMAERFGVDPVEAARAITRSGGLKPAQNFRELAQRRSSSMKELFDGGDGSPIGVIDSIWRPTTALMRDKVGKGAARDYEQAFESAARDSELLYRNYVNNAPVSRALSDWMEQDGVKRRFLNLHRTGKAGLGELRQMAKTLDPKVQEMFEQLISQSEKQRSEVTKLYKKEVLSDPVYWASQKKAPERSGIDKIKDAFSTKRQTASKKIEGVKDRFRGDAFELSEEALAEYENPMVAQLARMNEEITGKHLADRFGVKAAIGKNGDMGDLFNEIERVAAASSGSEDKAILLRGMIEDTWAGQKAAPPKWMQTFMKQSYAGTLGQVDSAMMNLHDIAVAAWRMGPKNTAKGLWDSLFGGAKEFDLRELGITNTNNSVTEFREGVGRALEQTGKLDRAVEAYSNVAFKYSGFQALDRLGKGTAMRAALHKFRDDAAKRGFVRDYSHLVKPGEAAQVKAALSNGTKLSDMTAKQQDIVERMVFAKLGEQQLISAAGRPLLYLQVPAARPLWAMTGFAIKQSDMLKMAVWDEARKGNWVKAGEAAVGYMAYVAVGYAIVDTVRNLPSYAITGDDRKGPQNFGSRVIDQPLAAASLNRLDTRTFERTAADPYGEIAKTAVAPGGLVGNVLKDAGRAATGKEFKGYFLKSVPGGDYLYDMFNN